MKSTNQEMKQSCPLKKKVSWAMEDQSESPPQQLVVKLIRLVQRRKQPL
jgi:hypothetical protein